MNDELVEGFLRSHLSSLTCSKLDEGALLPLHYSDGTDLPELVEMVPVERERAGEPTHSSEFQSQLEGQVSQL